MLDVAIIGGGVAGLTAAWRLQEAGRSGIVQKQVVCLRRLGIPEDAASDLDVCPIQPAVFANALAATKRRNSDNLFLDNPSVRVFEARDRLGGCAHSPLVDGSPMDLGATWVWDTERAVHGVLAELQVATVAHHDAGIDVYEGRDGIQHGRFQRSTVLSRRIQGGMGALVSALDRRVQEVQRGVPVRSLEPSAEGVQVFTDSDTVLARQVLAALPPRLLAPLVPAPHPLWERTPVWMGDTTKVVGQFATALWKEQGFSGRGYSERGPMGEVHDLSEPDAPRYAAGPSRDARAAAPDRLRDLRGESWARRWCDRTRSGRVPRADPLNISGLRSSGRLGSGAAAWATRSCRAAGFGR